MLVRRRPIKVRNRPTRVTPDPEFLKFFDGDFERRLLTCKIPGMDQPSWDRRAAYLLWLAEKEKA